MATRCSVEGKLTITIWFVATNAQGSRASQIPTVPYCELITSPDTYDGKQIRLRAEYDSGFEHSVFADSRCVKVWDAKKLVWVKFDDHVDSNTNQAIATRFNNVQWRPETDRDGRIIDMSRSWRVNLSVVGVFRRSKDPNFGFGHNIVYPFMIVVSKIERVGKLKKL